MPVSHSSSASLEGDCLALPSTAPPGLSNTNPEKGTRAFRTTVFPRGPPTTCPKPLLRGFSFLPYTHLTSNGGNSAGTFTQRTLVPLSRNRLQVTTTETQHKGLENNFPKFPKRSFEFDCLQLFYLLSMMRSLRRARVRHSLYWDSSSTNKRLHLWEEEQECAVGVQHVLE